MINIFDLSAGMAGTMMLTEKVHRDGSPARRCRSEVNKVLDPVGGLVEDKPVTHESRSSLSKKSSGTPMKKLIEQEMSKEMEIKRKPPGVVAKLMGLDALPTPQQSATVTQRAMQEGKPNGRNSGCGVIQDHQHQGKVYLEKMVTQNIQSFRSYANKNREYKDVYEVCQRPSRPGHFKDEPFLRGRYRESPSDKRMALVRQKFIEAKRLATNQKLLQSKEFLDALEVLSSNRDLFLKFLEEPNSLFSKYLHEVQISPLPAQAKRITVLKPSKSLDIGIERKTKNCAPVLEANSWDRNMPGWGSSFLNQKTESLPQPTRIVVLKPSPGKPHNTKDSSTSPTMTLRIPKGEDLFEDLGADVARGSREVAKEITRQMQESFSSRRDETLLSSVLSNGYTGDESSFCKTEDENMEDECGNFSDLEIATPTSRHSWDCVNRFDSPYSLSSFSRASYSPESSVIVEAKKRLSERWVMLTSNEMGREQRQVRRSTSTLGEMLAFTESKREEETNASRAVLRGGSCGGDLDLNEALSCMPSNKNSEENGGETMPSSLQRSKSVPASCSTHDTVILKPEASNSHKIKSSDPIDKKKSGMSSFKGKVSSFLFSRNKKLSPEKSLPPLDADSLVRVQSCNNESDASGCNLPMQSSLQDLEGALGMIPFQTSDQHGQRVETTIPKVSTTIEKPRTFENASGNLGQPSPVSVLESPFEDDINYGPSQPCESVNTDCHRAISRSPPIESIARSLCLDGAYSEKTIANPSKHSTDFLRADIEEHERVMFVQTILSLAGLGNETSSMVFAGWHSLESPLNPALLDKFMERKEEAAKCREKRSKQRLLFDCINAALLEISWNKVIDRCMYSTFCLRFPNGVTAANSVTEEVLKRLREWFSSVEKLAFRCTEKGSQLVDSIVRKEVDGNEWAEMAGSEMGDLGREIEGLVLEELVGEALDDFIGGCV